jgi:predicted MFS family arabinose efflux permease
MSTIVEERAAVVRGRVAVSLLFLLYGTVLGTWTARIPAVKHTLGLSDGQLSIGLLAFAGGAVVGMQASGRLVDQYRSRRVMIPASFADAVVLLLPAFAFNLASLGAALFLFGAVHGHLNVAMNVNAVEVQRAWRAPIISSCHAVYSIGGFLGAGIGGLFAFAGLTAATTFASVAVAMIALAAWAAMWALSPDRAERSAPDGAPEGGITRGVLFLGVLVFCCLVGEGAAADWSSVYVQDDLGARAGFAATAYSGFSIAMMAGRLAGDRLVARLGPVRLVRGSGAIAAVGLATSLLVHHPVAGVMGFACLGAGLSCIAPQVFSAAGSRDPERAGRAIGRVAGLGFLGFVVGPVVIGAAAQRFGLPHALLIPAVLALFVAAAAQALAPQRPPAPA